MFIVCEPISLGMEHVPFNTALLRTIRLAFPEKKISFFSEAVHSNYVKEQIDEKDETSIEWHHVVPPARPSKFFKRLSKDFSIIKFLLEKKGKDSEDSVLVVTGNASILWALKYYTAFSHKNKKVQVVIHGDFSTLTRIPRREMLNPFYYVGCLKTALKLPGYQRLQHIVLEEAIRNKVLEALPFLEKSTYVFDHPVPVDGDHEINETNINTIDLPIRFGFIGHGTEKKGFSKFLEVACEITKQFPGKVKFHFIGRVSDKILRKKATQLSCLNEMPGKERLDRSDYAKRMQSLHYVCLFFKNYYEFCASGVLMDSIAWQKPVIASQLMIFKKIEEQFGDIGYLCAEDNISETIRGIIRDMDSTRYQKQVGNIGALKISRKPEILAIKYRELVNLLELREPR